MTPKPPPIVAQYHQSLLRTRSPKYARKTAALVQRFLAGRQARRIIPADVEAFLAAEGREGAAPHTLRNDLSALSRFFRFAIAAGERPDNPAALVPPPGSKRCPPALLSDPEVGTIPGAPGAAAAFPSAALTLPTPPSTTPPIAPTPSAGPDPGAPKPQEPPEKPAPMMTDPATLLREFEEAALLTAHPDQVRTITHLVAEFLAGCSPGPITPASVEKFLIAKRQAGRSPKTLMNVKSAISRFCRFLLIRGDLASNPTTLVRLPRIEQRPPIFLDNVEVLRVLEVAEQRKCWPAVALALSTGLRLSELRCIRWADVDWQRRLLLVPKSKSKRPRWVPLSDRALEALQRQRALSGHFACVFPARQTYPHGYDWVDRPVSVRTMLKILRPVTARIAKFNVLPAGSVGRAWHLFRHTFASTLAQRGVSIYKISTWLGHSTLAMTQRYAHLSEEFDAEVMKAD